MPGKTSLTWGQVGNRDPIWVLLGIELASYGPSCRFLSLFGWAPVGVAALGRKGGEAVEQETVEQETVTVPVQALRAFVGRADGWRFQAVPHHLGGGTKEQQASDREFREVVDALGVPGLPAPLLAELSGLRAKVARVEALLYPGREGHVRQAELRRALDGES
jgi:hypothetical protein